MTGKERQVLLRESECRAQAPGWEQSSEGRRCADTQHCSFRRNSSFSDLQGPWSSLFSLERGLGTDPKYPKVLNGKFLC